MSAENKAPAIRFKEFNEAWDEKILGELFKLENGFAFKSKHFKTEPTNVIVLTPGSVNIGGGFQDGKGQYYDIKQDVPDRYIFKPGDIFITMTDLTPTAQALGFPAIVPRDGNKYLHNQRLGKLIEFKGDLDFLFHLLCTPKMQKEVVLTSSGTTVKHTSPGKFLNRYSCFPKKSEQTKIGNYFQQLDTLITQHQQKHDKLLNLKKALLKKMFPKQGEKVPEIRFKGFSGEWEEKALGEIAEFNPKAELPTIFEYVDLESVLGTEMIAHRTESKNAAPSRAQRLARQDDVFYQTVRPYQKNNHLFDKAENNYVFSTGYAQMRPYGDSYFLLSLVQNAEFVRSVLDNCTGTSYPAINSTDLANIQKHFPEKNEQTKIGNFFKQIDTLLNQHQAQLKKLNNIKQACLEKMFV
jgi:type I restriction enzyme S subunit